MCSKAAGGHRFHLLLLLLLLLQPWTTSNTLPTRPLSEMRSRGSSPCTPTSTLSTSCWSGWRSRCYRTRSGSMSSPLKVGQDPGDGGGGWMDAGSMWVGWWKMGDSRLHFQPGDGLLDVAQSAWIVGGKVYLMFPQSFSLLGKSCSGCESCHVWVPRISREKQSSYHTVRHSLKSPHEHRVALFKEDPVWF